MFSCRVMLTNVCVSYNCGTHELPDLHPHFHGAGAGLAHQRCRGRQVSRKGSRGWKESNSSVSLGTARTGDKQEQFHSGELPLAGLRAGPASCHSPRPAPRCPCRAARGREIAFLSPCGAHRSLLHL